MLYTYHEPKTEGIPNLICQEASFGRQLFKERQSRLLTIARNTDSDQTMTIDSNEHRFPRQTVLPLIIDQPNA
jgi:hypothetical protein